MRFAIIMFALTTSLGTLAAADGGASIKPAPGFEPPKATQPGGAPSPMGTPAAGQPGAVRQLPMNMARPSMVYEVDAVQIDPGDPAGLAAWAELAAQGFHLVAATSEAGKQTLFVERMRASGSAEVRLPSAVVADGARASALQAKLQQIIADRQPRPAPIPAAEGK